jgi:hypothetical protein
MAIKDGDSSKIRKTADEAPMEMYPEENKIKGGNGSTLYAGIADGHFFSAVHG